MTVRVRYRPGDLYDSIVETFPEANAWDEDEDGNLLLIYEDEDGHLARVGKVRRTRWESVVIEDEEDEETEEDDRP